MSQNATGHQGISPGHQGAPPSNHAMASRAYLNLQIVNVAEATLAQAHATLALVDEMITMRALLRESLDAIVLAIRDGQK